MQYLNICKALQTVHAILLSFSNFLGKFSVILTGAKLNNGLVRLGIILPPGQFSPLYHPRNICWTFPLTPLNSLDCNRHRGFFQFSKSAICVYPNLPLISMARVNGSVRIFCPTENNLQLFVMR